MAEPEDAPHVHDHEAHIDGCACDFELLEAEITPDSALPAAAGGVQTSASEPLDEDHIDGCDADFGAGDVTADEELPVATGGVA